MYNKFYINNNLISKNICTFASRDDSQRDIAHNSKNAHNANLSFNLSPLLIALLIL